VDRLKCILLIRNHHLIKTFWGWDDTQLADGRVTRLRYALGTVRSRMSSVDFHEMHRLHNRSALSVY
jgi:hypothetical protein